MTHVTGIACGNGSLSQGVYCGIAPHVNIVSIKILDRGGQGNSAQAVRALRWIMDNFRKYNIRVVNLSIGTNDRKVNLPLKEAVEQLWQAGIVVVAAAGNPDGHSGHRPPPAVSSGVISVGAWEDRQYFQSASFSRFTREESPDLWAMGDDIISVLSPDYDFTLPNRSRRNVVHPHYIRMSGASMATPFVSGAAARLLERHPRAHPREIKKMLLQLTLPTEGLLTREMLLT
ncbi:S8 family serine peptidase [Anaerotignum sp.]